jgi:hypothetical protein
MFDPSEIDLSKKNSKMETIIAEKPKMKMVNHSL